MRKQTSKQANKQLDKQEANQRNNQTEVKNKQTNKQTKTKKQKQRPKKPKQTPNKTKQESWVSQRHRMSITLLLKHPVGYYPLVRPPVQKVDVLVFQKHQTGTAAMAFGFSARPPSGYLPCQRHSGLVRACGS